MRRTTVWLWITGGVLLTGSLAAGGGWWALRQWPGEIGPRLPPSLAYALIGWGPAEASAARSCFGDYEGYWFDQPMTPAQEDARNAVLCAELRGSRERQIAVLAFIAEANSAGAITGFVPASPERDALVFALTGSADRELREAAHACWRSNGPSPFRTVRRLTPDPDDHSPLSPDGWAAGPAAAIAWQMMIIQNAGYDHKTPNKYRDHLQDLIKRLLASIDRHGMLLADPRDSAIALLALAEAYGMTNDPELKPLVERGRDALLADPQRLQRLWLEDTTAAVLTVMVYRALLAAGVDVSAMQPSLTSGIDAWWSGNLEAEPPPWFAQGRPVAATIAERWGALMVSLDDAHRHPTRQATYPANPPAWIADPGDSTPLGRYLIRLAGYLPNGKTWDRAYEQRCDALLAARLITPDHQPPEGFWPGTKSVSGTWETTFALLEIGLYRPYTPPTPPTLPTSPTP